MLDAPGANAIDFKGDFMELWKDVVGYEGIYQVSNKGRVKRLAQKRINSNQTTSWEQVYPESFLRGGIDSKGYRQVNLSFGLKGNNYLLLHRVVAMAFLEEPSEELKEECLKGGYKVVLVNHKDSDRLNNEADNLEWCTPSYNADYMMETNKPDYSGRSGSNARHSVLVEADVDEILRMRLLGRSQQHIADCFGVKQITISNIVTGRSWSSYTGIPRKERNKGKNAAKSKSINNQGE